MKNETIIFPARFNKDKDKWEYLSSIGPNINTDILTFVTYNIWFDDFFFKERFQATSKLLKNTNADIIALQEITDDSLELLLQEDWVKDNYFISDISGSTFHSYGVILLSKIPLKNLYLYQLPSIMDRKVLIAEFVINEKKMLISTTHLESMKLSSSIRSIQLKEIFELLNDSNNSVLMGDFNFCSSWEENTNIESSYLDFWEVLQTNESGYTEDTNMNAMTRQKKGKVKAVRFDRIISRSVENEWKPKKINRIGMQSISAELPDIFPSDHFGLFGVLEWKNILPS